MLDATRSRPHPFAGRTSRSAALALTLMAMSLAAACDTTAPPDTALVSALSSEETVALCDELRDAISRDDRPIECSGRELHWVVPSNQSCRDADVSDCAATAGDIRAWHELVRSDPCNAVSPSMVGYTLEPIELEQSGCSELAPQLRATEAPCTGEYLANLQVVDGVYEVIASTVPAMVSCDERLPALLDRDALRFVLVATQASGVLEVILQGCDAVADCQALGRQLRERGEPISVDPDAYRYNHFGVCGTLYATDDFGIVSRAPEGVPSCEVPWLPSSLLLYRGPAAVNPSTREPSGRVTVLVSPGSTLVQASPGCGYVVSPSPEVSVACTSSARYEGRFEAPL